MYFERLVIESADDGWVRFHCPSAFAADRSGTLFQLPAGFTFDDILNAVQATGWVVVRNGELRIQDHVGCRRLVQLLEQMCSYFERSGNPSRKLLSIQQQVLSHFEDAEEIGPRIPFWAFAWLDLMLREDVAEEASSADCLWTTSGFSLDVKRLRARQIQALYERYSASESNASPRITQSARVRSGASIRSQTAG
jgi:hypothetical protein